MLNRSTSVLPVKPPKRITLLLLTALAFTFGVFAQNDAPKMVDFRADVMRPVKVGDSSVLSLVGNVVFHHNGAVITCDSAIRYSDKLMDCFKNVIINKDSTFIYGDKADYNGNTNTARVYSPLVKMVDKDATLYTSDFSFNTLDNIGRYSGGGTLTQEANLLESLEGYYYSSRREMVAVREVEMSTPEYRIKGDSVSYNLDTEQAFFHTRTYIWNDKDEFLTARRGDYDRLQERYTFTDSSYIMTRTQEVWADTIVYSQTSQDAVLVRNIQVHDGEQKSMAFGDYGQHWGEPGTTLLTRRPSVLSYDNSNDTIYMRSDTIFIYTIKAGDENAGAAADSLLSGVDPERVISDLFSPDSIASNSIALDSIAPDGSAVVKSPDAGTALSSDTSNISNPSDASNAESTMSEDGGVDGGMYETPADLTPAGPPSPSANELKRLAQEAKTKEREQTRLAKEEERKARDAARKVQDSIRYADYKAKLAVREAAAEEKRLAQMARKGIQPSAADTTSRTDNTKIEIPMDSTTVTDSLALAEVSAQANQTDSVAVQRDSIQRIMRGYRDVRIFRSDLQAVCDSIVGFTLDSTVHLYINPVVWNENNQIKSQDITIFIKNGTIDRALFTGEPIMSSEVEPNTFNQVKGKTIEAFFRDGQIVRTDVIGNGQTYYYMEDTDSLGRKYLGGFLVVESADISFYFEDKQMDNIVYRGEPVYSVYPIDKIPETQSQLMRGFVWEPHRRPTKADVFDRTVRPSERERFEAMPKPLYPISERIGEEKTRLQETGTWFDRNDQLSIEAVEFIRSLGL